MLKRTLIAVMIGMLAVVAIYGCNSNTGVETSTTEVKKTLPVVLYEEEVSNYATSMGGAINTGNGYIVYLYYPNCQYCTQLMETDEYKAFEANPDVRFYKVNVSADGIEEFINAFGDDLRTPTLYYIEKNGDSYILVKKVVGKTEEALELLSDHTK